MSINQSIAESLIDMGLQLAINGIAQITPSAVHVLPSGLRKPRIDVHQSSETCSLILI